MLLFPHLLKKCCVFYDNSQQGAESTTTWLLYSSQSFTRLPLFTVEQEDIMPWSSGTYLFNQGTISYFPYHTSDISVRNALMAIIGIIQFPHPLHTTSNVYCSTQKDQGRSSYITFIWTNAHIENITLFLAMALFHFSCSGLQVPDPQECIVSEKPRSLEVKKAEIPKVRGNNDAFKLSQIIVFFTWKALHK